jgi:hypothetical protein
VTPKTLNTLVPTDAASRGDAAAHHRALEQLATALATLLAAFWSRQRSAQSQSGDGEPVRQRTAGSTR